MVWYFVACRCGVVIGSCFRLLLVFWFTTVFFVTLVSVVVLVARLVVWLCCGLVSLIFGLSFVCF